MTGLYGFVSVLLLLVGCLAEPQVLYESKLVNGVPENTGSRSLLDSTIINELLARVAVKVPTSEIPNQSFTQSFTGGRLEMKINVGGDSKNDGLCNGFALDGVLRLLGEEIEPLNGKQRFNFTLQGTGIKFTCNIELRVKIDKLVIAFVSVPLGGIQSSDTGEFIFKAVDPGVNFEQSLIVESSDFTEEAPTAGIPGDCVFVFNQLSFDAIDVLALFDNVLPGGINLDGQIEKALRDDATLIAAPIQEALCAQSFRLMETLSNLISNNPLTELGPNSSFPGGNLLDANLNGQIDAIDLEEELTQNISDDLLNMQSGNFIIKALFPQGGNSELDLLGNFFDSFEIDGVTVSQNDAFGLIVAIMNLALGTEIEVPVINLDLFPVILTVLDKLDLETELFEDVDGSPVMVFFNNTVSVDNALNSSIRVVATELTLSEDGGRNDDAGLFSSMETLGNHSVLLPSFDMGNLIIRLKMQLDVDLTIDSEGAGASDFIQDIAVTWPREELNVELNLTNLIAEVAALLPINETTLNGLQIGPLTTDSLNCISAALATSLRVTGFGAKVNKIDGLIFGFNDVLLNFAGDVANTMLFNYQSVVLRVVETLLFQQLEGLEPITPGVCEPLAADENNTVQPYDFSQGIFPTLVEIGDAELFENALGFFLANDGSSFEFIGEDDDLTFGMTMLPLGGYQQGINFRVHSVTFDGISPPKVNEAGVGLSKNEALFPQGIVIEANAADRFSPISARAILTIETTEPFIDPDALPGDIADSPPDALLGTNSTSTLDITLSLDSIEALFEIFATMSQYDIDGTTVENALNIDCWVGKLDPFGGWTDALKVTTKLAKVEAKCDCESPLFAALTESLNQVSGWGELNFDLQQLIDAFVKILPDKYSKDNFEFTVNNAQRACAGLPKLEKQFDSQPVGEQDFTVYGFIGLLVVSIGFTFPCMCIAACTKKPAKTQETNAAGEQTEQNREEMEAKMKRFEEFTEMNKLKSEKVPLYQNEHIPKKLRLIVPSILALNLVLFVYGDLGISLNIVLKGNIFDASFGEQDFGSFSVLTSTIDLFEHGAYGLAILIIVVALIWPYLKLMGLTLCFFSSKIGLKTRGRALHLFDSFGKWSMIEMFFIVIIRLIFELKASSPRNLYFPDENLYQVELLFTPQASFYTFASAVLLSIVVSNILVIYHEKIVRKNQDELRNIVNIKETDLNVFIKQKITDFKFIVRKKHIDGSPNYTYSVSERGALVLTAFTVLCMVLTLIVCSLEIITITYLGLARLFLAFDNLPVVVGFSVYSLISNVISAGTAEGDFGAVFLGLLLTFAEIVAPLLVLYSSLVFLHRGLTLAEARRYRVYRTALSAWCALEVLVLSIAVAVIEVPAIATAFTEESCGFMRDFMQETLEPMGIVNSEDVENTCFGVRVEIPAGGYFFLIVIFLNFLNAHFVLTLLDNMIKQRKEGEKASETDIVKRPSEEFDPAAIGDDAYEKVNYSFSIRVLKKLGLVSGYRDDGIVSL